MLTPSEVEAEAKAAADKAATAVIAAHQARLEQARQQERLEQARERDRKAKALAKKRAEQIEQSNAQAK